MHRRRALVACTLLVAACTPTDPDPAPTPTVEPVEVGTAADGESRLLAATAGVLLEARGLPVLLREFDQPEDARKALELADIDVLPGYTGATWLEAMGRPDPPGDPRTSFRRVRQLDLQNDVFWLRPALPLDESLETPPANATFAFFVRGVPAPTAGLETMSQLATLLAESPDAKLCVDPQFLERPDGLDPVLRAYGIRLEIEVAPVPPQDAVNVVALGECIAGLSTATDGRAWQAGLKPLRDDLDVFPAFVVSLVVPTALSNQRPEIPAALEPLLAELTTRLLGEHNARVVAGERVEVVATDLAAELMARHEAGGQPAPAEPAPVPEEERGG